MAIDGHMMRLGGFTFHIGTAAYTKLSRTDNWRWVEQARLDNYPAEQLVGPGNTTVALEGAVFAAYNPGGGAGDYARRTVGTGQIDAMRAVADSGEPQMLVDGRGNVLGLFVIKSITEDAETFLSNGAPRKQSFTISLTSYGEDSGAGFLDLGGAIDSILGAALGGELGNAFSGISDAFQSLAATNIDAARIATDLVGYGISTIPAATIGVESTYFSSSNPQVSELAPQVAKNFGAVYALPPTQYRYAVNRLGELLAARDYEDGVDVIAKALPAVNVAHDLLGIAMNEAAAVTLALTDVAGLEVNRGAYLTEVAAQVKKLMEASETARISLDIDLDPIYDENGVQRFSRLLQQLRASRQYHTAQFNTFFPPGSTVYLRHLLDNFSAFEQARIATYVGIPTGIIPVALG